MTAQIGEQLHYNGKTRTIASEPLEAILLNRNDIDFISPTSACWRGYYGQWEIKNNKLYLIGLKAYIEQYKEVGISYLFPGQKEVFADWFSGDIRIPDGELLTYIHLGYDSTYERDIILTFKKGALVGEKRIIN